MNILKVISLPSSEFLNHCSYKNYQGSGSGGQKRNRKLSGVQLFFPTLNLEIKCCEARNTQTNLQKAVKLMKMEIALTYQMQSSQLIDTPPFPGSNNKINVSNSNYPLFVMYSLNLLKEFQGQVKDVATKWNLSSSAFSKIIFSDKKFLAKVQQTRNEFNKKPLHNPNK